MPGPFHASARYYDEVYGHVDYRGHALAIDAAVRANRLDARSLLDVACGTGRHLEVLRGRYDDLAGLDIDPTLVEIARSRNPGAEIHLGDMTAFDFGRRFDVITCLFSSIGYVRTEDRLRTALAAMAAHLHRGGVLVIEPWFSPEAWEEGRVVLHTVDRPNLKIARVSRSVPSRHAVSRLVFDYLVATPDRVESFSEIHEMGLFTEGQYLAAAEAAGLEAAFDPEGPMGRGLLLAVRLPDQV
jgi:SAM-dependent methyltransferase